VWPELFRLPVIDVPLRSFGLLLGLGFLTAVWMGARLAARYGSDPKRDPERLYDVAWWVLIGVVAGARLAFVLINLPHYLEHPLDVVKIWEGGLVMYGGLILALVLGGWKVKRLGMPLWRTADYGLTAGFLGQAIGRLGCLAVGDDYGAPTSVPWAITFPDPLPRGSAFPPELAGVPVHPTQLYLALAAFGLFLLGLWLLPRKRFHGQVVAVLLVAYAVSRFVIEAFRGDALARRGLFRAGATPEDAIARLAEHGVRVDPAGRIMDPDRYRELLLQGVEGIRPELLLSTSQMISIAVVVFGLGLYLVLGRRPELRVTPDA